MTLTADIILNAHRVVFKLTDLVHVGVIDNNNTNGNF